MVVVVEAAHGHEGLGDFWVEHIFEDLYGMEGGYFCQILFDVFSFGCVDEFLASVGGDL